MNDNTDEHNPNIYATVDLGSNSFHLLVAEADSQSFRIIDRIRESVRLAEGLNSNGVLDEQAKTRALEAMARFEQRLRGIPSERVRIIGTNTLRKASKDGDFIRRIEEILGDVEVVSGVEEARLIHLGVSHGRDDMAQPHLVVDIGGGSTELIVGSRFEAVYLESLYMGCVSMSEAYFGNGKISLSRIARAMVAAKLELRPIRQRVLQFNWSVTVGTSGTIKAVSKVLLEKNWTDGTITREGLHQLLNELRSCGDVSKLD